MLNWVTIIITLVGGLALFLYGMNLMSEGFNKSAGKQVRQMLHVFTRNRFTALLTGIISTSFVQSSSAVSVMVISLVKAGLLKFTQTFGILLGAAIGTTITAQIIAFNFSEYALLVVALGFFVQLLSSNQVVKIIGGAILGFGLLFFGMYLMSQAVSPLKDYGPFLNLLTGLEKPWAGLLAGFIATAIIQSSGAFIGIVIVLASQGLVNLETGIALLLGSNIGTTVTAIIASFNAGYESKRVALAFFSIKLFGALLVIGWVPTYALLVESISYGLSDETVPLTRLIANAHTIFNVFITLVLIPFSNTFSSRIIKIVPERKKKIPEPVSVRYLDDSLIKTPALALSLAKKEVLHMGTYVLAMIEDIIDPFVNKNSAKITRIKENENRVDHLRKKTAIYLTSIRQQQLEHSLAEENFKILYINAEIEEMADIISTTLLEKAEEWIDTAEKDFSEEGKKEIISFHQQTVEQFRLTLQVIDTLDQKVAVKLKKEHKKIRELADQLKHSHFERLSQNVTESIKTSKLHMEIVSSLRMMHSHIANIMRVIVRND